MTETRLLCTTHASGADAIIEARRLTDSILYLGGDIESITASGVWAFRGAEVLFSDPIDAMAGVLDPRSRRIKNGSMLYKETDRSMIKVIGSFPADDKKGQPAAATSFKLSIEMDDQAADGSVSDPYDVPAEARPTKAEIETEETLHGTGWKDGPDA